MKTMFRLLTVLAFANLLALAGFGGWLYATGRVDEARLERIREMFSTTVVEEQLTLGEIAAKDAEKVRLDGEARSLLEVPLSRTEQIVTSERFEERAALAMRGLEDSHHRLQQDLIEREQGVTQREEALVERTKEWEASIATEKDRTTDEQFRKAVRLLESVPPKQGREWILELVKRDRESTAVAYLDAMNRAKCSALLKAFKGEAEAKVATDLLERVRLLGLESEAGSERPNAAKSADSSVNRGINPARSPLPAGGAANLGTPARGAPNSPLTLPRPDATGSAPSAGKPNAQ